MAMSYWIPAAHSLVAVCVGDQVEMNPAIPDNTHGTGNGQRGEEI